MTTSVPNKCPVCDGDMHRLDIPDRKLYRCHTCGEIGQLVVGDVLSPIGQFLKRNEMGDDRARAAISTPHVNTAKSFLDVFESKHSMSELVLAEARGELRTVLTQIVNRLDQALSTLSGLDLASDAVGEALAAIREARELASPLPGRNRGIPAEG